MVVLKEIIEEAGCEKTRLDEGAYRSWGLQEGRNLCKKIIDKAKASNSAGDYNVSTIQDALAGVLDGVNMQILQIAGKEKSQVLNNISMVLDDAFTEISKLRV
jgi:hypothetical protein